MCHIVALDFNFLIYYPDYFAAGFKFIGLSLEGIKIIRVLINIYELDNNLDNLAN
jgi:hypothetical protein